MTVPPPARQVTVRLQDRQVIADSDAEEHFVYAGITLVYLSDGVPMCERWLPTGRPTEADDEALIAALHDALLWSNGATSKPTSV